MLSKYDVSQQFYSQKLLKYALFQTYDEICKAMQNFVFNSAFFLLEKGSSDTRKNTHLCIMRF